VFGAAAKGDLVASAVMAAAASGIVFNPVFNMELSFSSRWTSACEAY
jgi:hypothetical protein